MKIRNDYIIINHNGKQTKLHNTILNKYIETIIDNQLTVDENERVTFSLTYAYLKFDNQLSFDKTSVLTENDFDVRIIYYQANNEISPKQIISNHYYKFDSSQYNAYDINIGEYITDLNNYLNKKITAIGFGDNYLGISRMYACIDTSNYNLYIESMDEVFSITRRDILSTDAIFYCPSKIVKGPIHLIDSYEDYSNGIPDYKIIAALHSIGLGVTPYYMGEEHTLLPYEEHVTTQTNQINIVDELTIEYKSSGLFPDIDLYPSSDVYPARIINEPIYPSEDIYPGLGQYMADIPYQYVILKYELYEQDTFDGTITDTGKYYLLSNLINNKEKIKINIEYES